ncbi:MAG: UPF0489 family protein [Candidatus Gracilibacteria bacterium]|nr:UPF0489 family protein [Candidatus Gracilibacteria bacterium]
MFYKKGFYIKKPVGNNEFSFEQRKNKKLFVPEIIDLDIGDLDKIEIQDDLDKIAFEDFGFDDKMSTNYGLKNFYRINKNGKEIILFDNHNHAFYFWYEARERGIIGDNNLLIHIDEHADTRDNDKHLLKPDSLDLEKVFSFTNEVINVGDYIIPALEEGLISEIIQIRNTKNLEDYIEKYYDKSVLEFNLFHSETQPIKDWDSNSLHSINKISKTDFRYNNIILNLDLDFFQKELDFIDYELKKKVIRDAFEKADFITVSTSPFFIDQELAIKVFKDLFGNL